MMVVVLMMVLVMVVMMILAVMVMVVMVVVVVIVSRADELDQISSKIHAYKQREEKVIKSKKKN